VRNNTNTGCDGSTNIVVFSMTEDRNSTVWREQVLDALQHVDGRTVDTDDMFRVGRFVAGKTRPVVVRLRSIWDRRLIVSSSYKLKNYNDVCLFDRMKLWKLD